MNNVYWKCTVAKASSGKMSAIYNSQMKVLCVFYHTFNMMTNTTFHRQCLKSWQPQDVCVCHVSMRNASHGCQQAVIPRQRDKTLYDTVENVIRCCQINFPIFHQTEHQMTGGQPW